MTSISAIYKKSVWVLSQKKYLRFDLKFLVWTWKVVWLMIACFCGGF